MKRFLIPVAVFLASFTFAAWIFFPYQIIMNRLLSIAQNNLKISITYKSGYSGIFTTDYTGMEINGIEIGDVTIDRNPLNLLLGRAGVKIKGIYETDAVLTLKSISFSTETTGKALDFLNAPVSLEGTVKASGVIHPFAENSEITASAERLGIPTPLGEINFEKVYADISTDKNIIDIRTLSSDDSKELKMSGTVRLNPRNAPLSDVNLKGSLKFAGIKKGIRLQGMAKNLHPIID